MNAGTVTITTSPTEICPLAYERAVIIQNASDAAVFLGGATVAATGSAAGISLAAGDTLTIPFGGGTPLYGVVASGTGAVAFLTA